MRRTKVLRIIARMNVGGPALQVANLTRNLDPDRFDQRVLTGAVGPGEEDFVALRQPDLQVERVPGLGRAPRPQDDVLALRHLYRTMRDFRPDIVHTHTAKAGFLGRTAARGARVPAVVHTFHGHLLHGYFSPAVTRAVVLAERALARGTTTLVTVGGSVRDDLLGAGIGRPDQYRVIPPGIELAAPPSRAEARRQLGLAADTPVIAFVARLTQVKRPDRALAAIEQVARAHPDVVLLVVGEGPLLDDVRSAAAGLGAHVRFLGWRSDVEAIYAAADLVLLTSDNEGTPISIIEAALCGVPAVSTDVGSVREVVVDGETGVLAPTDPGALAAAAIELLGDHERRAALGAAAQERARSRYGPERLVRDTEALYAELAGRAMTR